MKPHKGLIEGWRKMDVPNLLTQEVKGQKNLGYFIIGRPIGHPEFINWIYTSLIVKHEGNEVETLNSRYTLGEPYAEKSGRVEGEEVQEGRKEIE